MDDVKPLKPWHHGQTGTTGKELEEMDDGFKAMTVEEMFPADSQGNRESLGNSVAHTYEEMPEGYITNRRGYVEDPPVSQAQNRAMRAAAGGHSTLGIPQSVGQEYVKSTHGHHLGHLPEHVKHKKGH